MKDEASTDDQRRTLAWLDDSLEWARSGGRVRLMEFLNLVRAEVVFDLDYSESPPSVRNRATAFWPEPDANGSA